MIRILFMGQKPIGEKCFEDLLKADGSGLCVCAVVSNKGRNVWWGTNNINLLARQKKLEFIGNEKRNYADIKRAIRRNKINMIISVQNPWIIPDRILSMVDGRAFNLHNAKLPDYRGCNACNHAILNNEKKYTSTIHWMVPKVDNGPIVLERTIAINPTETARSLYDRSQESSLILFKEFIDSLLQGEIIPKKAIVGKGKFFSRNSLDKLRRIKSLANMDEVDRKARAFYFPPFEPAYIIVKRRKYYILPEDM